MTGPDAPPVDSRAQRSAQAVIGVVLLAGFVFHLPEIAPIVGVIAAVAAIAGPSGDLFLLGYRRTIGTRLAASPTTVPVADIRAQHALLAIALALASIAFLIDVWFVAWLIAIAAGVSAIVAATTLVHVGALVRNRLGR